MSDRFEKCAEDSLNSVKMRHTCVWCRHPNKIVYCRGMCRHCYDIRRDLKRLHKQVKRVKARFSEWPVANKFTRLELDYMTAVEMAESTQILGRAYVRYLDNTTSLDLENEFRLVSKRFLRRDLFNHDSFLFECFSPVHRRYLMHIVSRITQEYLRLNRRKMATGRILGKTMNEVLADRSWGTYRVEND